MVRASRLLLKDGGNIGKALSDFLVCPLSKQPLRHCEDSRSLISETIGVSFPIIDGIPCLVPKDAKLLEDQDKSQIENGADPSSGNSERVSREACLERPGPVRGEGGLVPSAVCQLMENLQGNWRSSSWSW